MRYSYEFKRNAVELYREGLWPETPKGVKEYNFRKMVRSWVRLEEANGPEVLKPKNYQYHWNPEEKFDLVSKVLDGHSMKSVAYDAGINQGMLYQWVQKYKILGYNGLVDKKKGRLSKDPQMKKINYNNPRKLKETEYEELIRLRAENEYIKAEIEVIKKEIALREQKEAAQLKAKKQQSSRAYAKKDTD